MNLMALKHVGAFLYFLKFDQGLFGPGINMNSLNRIILCGDILQLNADVGFFFFISHFHAILEFCKFLKNALSLACALLVNSIC